MQITLDGFVSGSKGELDWMTAETDERQIHYLQELTSSIDLILLGRKMAKESIPHWQKVADTQREGAEWEYAKTFVSTPKIVFSKTLNAIEGKNVRLEQNDLTDAVTRLKRQSGKGIIVYGGAQFVSALINTKLIDEYHLLVNPVAIGKGKSIFAHQHKLTLIKSHSFNNGVVANHYQPDRPTP